LDTNYVLDHLFDLLNDSNLLDVGEIESIKNGYIVAFKDGTKFRFICEKIGNE